MTDILAYGLNTGLHNLSNKDARKMFNTLTNTTDDLSERNIGTRLTTYTERHLTYLRDQLHALETQNYIAVTQGEQACTTLVQKYTRWVDPDWLVYALTNPIKQIHDTEHGPLDTDKALFILDWALHAYKYVLHLTKNTLISLQHDLSQCYSSIGQHAGPKGPTGKHKLLHEEIKGAESQLNKKLQTVTELITNDIKTSHVRKSLRTLRWVAHWTIIKTKKYATTTPLNNTTQLHECLIELADSQFYILSDVMAVAALKNKLHTLTKEKGIKSQGPLQSSHATPQTNGGQLQTREPTINLNQNATICSLATLKHYTNKEHYTTDDLHQSVEELTNLAISLSKTPAHVLLFMTHRHHLYELVQIIDGALQQETTNIRDLDVIHTHAGLDFRLSTICSTLTPTVGGAALAGIGFKGAGAVALGAAGGPLLIALSALAIVPLGAKLYAQYKQRTATYNKYKRAGVNTLRQLYQSVRTDVRDSETKFLLFLQTKELNRIGDSSV